MGSMCSSRKISTLSLWKVTGNSKGVRDQNSPKFPRNFLWFGCSRGETKMPSMGGWGVWMFSGTAQ